ncbi:hypothetical protein D8682_25175 [Buttiauxella sp. 3AFRM03]|uniref:hypothetical protein n=1 Tax=Buttiauxella sp. 3AFRM03 TaxID=2479367 RepID=UPI000EF8136D|nr:hypothetical protein [Buttiauxella sp. 3AFRM03]AYN29978.1 hypothetical protein D8682_25175 [Buttiauxella sp. 3AFRM03]
MTNKPDETVKSQVADFIKNNPGHRASEIAKGLGIKSSTAGTALSALFKEHRIEVQGRPGHYRYYAASSMSMPSGFGVSAGMKLFNDCLAKVRACQYQ